MSARTDVQAYPSLRTFARCLFIFVFQVFTSQIFSSQSFTSQVEALFAETPAEKFAEKKCKAFHASVIPDVVNEAGTLCGTASNLFGKIYGFSSDLFGKNSGVQSQQAQFIHICIHQGGRVGAPDFQEAFQVVSAEK